MSIKVVSPAHHALALAVALALATCDGDAITIAVNDNGDSVSPTGCTLRGAVTAVNNAAFGVADPCTTAGTFGNGDTIVFGTISSPITLAQGEITITKAIAIQGPGANSLTVSGNGASRIFYLNNYTALAVPVTISGLTLSGGNAQMNDGGAILDRGADLTLTNSVLSGNTTGVGNHTGGAIFAVNYGGVGALDIEYSTLTNNTANYGGAVRGFGLTQATINQSTFSSNTAGATGGAAYLRSDNTNLTDSTFSGNYSGKFGGAVALLAGSPTSNVVADHCTFTGNHQVKGAIYLWHGSPTISNSTISGNISSGNAGGVFAYDAAATITGSTISGNAGSGIYTLDATLSVQQSLISGNMGGNGGGLSLNNGVYGSHIGVTITNSTISGNTASGSGGGIFMPYEINVPVMLVGDTIAGNSAVYSGGGVFANISGSGTFTIESSTIASNDSEQSGAVYNKSANAIVLHNSIVANNKAPTDPDLQGNFIANYDFIRDTTGASFTGTPIILSGSDPMLGSLGYYGGPTPTILPKTGSPVIDVGDPGPTTLTTDQRGLTRVVGTHIDIGADERQITEDTIFLDGLEGY
jgi:hypothetical protein